LLRVFLFVIRTKVQAVSGIDELLEKIRAPRKQGRCLVNQEREEGLVSPAAPVMNRAGHTASPQ
jgi:IclR family transcriptional regulator, pca regulon regulatory protein